MYEFIMKGGPLMWPILLCSVWVIAVIIDRARAVYLAGKYILDPLKSASEKLTNGAPQEALSEAGRIKDPLSEIIETALNGPAGSLAREEKERRISRAGTIFLRRMEERVRSLSIVASITPILGLLGTVTGMIKAFITIQELHGQVDVALLAGGIWEALITTATGLAVAIPAQIAYHYFEGRVDDMSEEISDIAHNIIEYSETV